jgi:TRAP-type C4-dicarboxylate transport system substrate-binding protein
VILLPFAADAMDRRPRPASRFRDGGGGRGTSSFEPGGPISNTETQANVRDREQTLPGGFVSTENCILWPDDVSGQVTRAAGPAFERMLASAGASIASMPSSEIYTAMQTGVLDAANTSSASFVSFRVYEQVQCFTAPGEHTLWFMYEPILISKRSWDSLDQAQQAALQRAATVAEQYFDAEARRQDQAAEQVFRDAGVEVVHLNSAQFDAWRAIAAENSYAVFAEEVPGGRQLIDSALAVD